MELAISLHLIAALPLSHAIPLAGSSTLEPPMAVMLQDLTPPPAHFITHGVCYEA